MEEKQIRQNNFLLGLSITLGTIVIGLISYIIFSSDFQPNQEIPRCEYRGWAYAHGETFTMYNDCNVCVCSNGELLCTDMECPVDVGKDDLN